ncbi:phage tail sheath C-terminal domain-containing protein [Chitinimonas koreensis]|uniref:phage tail sheath C-terminal domain-containing protein n=1 Tax=Chitinimonas koreensis TaxID=356302 RepID=UPI000418FA2D|nr:phage tail sheath C-terminal domain-containing protein [Chitinimonas koreensis]QNM98658.1 phage tail sheath family protein [Chitinimonas koreensis]
MLASIRTPLAAPGVYPLPDAVAPRLNPQHMDVCAFVGVAPRGPAYLPVVDNRFPPGWRTMADLARPRRRSVAVAVKSFDEYRRLFGGFEGPGLLPFAVAGFFEQGGRLAWIVRAVPRQSGPTPPGEPPNLAGLSRGTLAGAFTAPLGLLARNQGSWGDRLTVEAGFSVQALGFASNAALEVLVDRADAVLPGSLLRIVDALGNRQFRFCRGLDARREGLLPRTRWALRFDAPLAVAAARIDVVHAWIAVDDGDGRGERFERLGLAPEHPRSLAAVLCDESTLLWPASGWAGAELLPADLAVELLRGKSGAFAGGDDGYGALTFEDFFDANWSPAEDEPGEGLTVLAGVDGVTQVVVPDLYLPAQWAGPEQDVETRIDEAGAEFADCVHSVATVAADSVAPSALTQLILDPRHAGDLATIGGLQNRLVEFCELTQSLIALIDVPPGLSQGQFERWRAGFDSSWGAAYHPWLVASRRAFSLDAERRDTLRPIPPSAVAAGIVARREIAYGLQHGPANELAREIVDLAEPVSAEQAAMRFALGGNCFVRDPDGIRLASARTLSRDGQWRQLSVRRLMLMLRRTLLAETQWAVFEPNGPKLWRDLRHAIEQLLRKLFRAGAFVGGSEAEAYFVRIRNEADRLDRGEVLVEIGVAPAEPLEFILIRLRRDGDGTLTLED